MRHRNHAGRSCLGALALMLSIVVGCSSTTQVEPGHPEPSQPIVLVVMDPLSKELACACVDGHGQRDYRKLASYLKAGLGRDVAVEFSDDLAETLGFIGQGREVIVVGERSLVMRGAQRAQFKA